MKDVTSMAPLAQSRRFFWATGLECSYPVITGKNGRQIRIDELEKTRHYQNWELDFQLTREMGLRYLRYGPPYYKVHLGAGKYDWEFVDLTFHKMKELEIIPIADLCHFGVPDFIGGFGNPDFAKLFAEFAEAFARRYPWVRYYTPVNEIDTTAQFSGLLGWWNDQEKSDRGYVTVLKNCVKAAILAEEAISKVQPDAFFIQSEGTSYYHALHPEAVDRANFLNARRFLPSDLSYGILVDSTMYQYLLDNGLSRDEYHWFMRQGQRLRPRCIMGNDYYAMNEHITPPGDEPITHSDRMFGYYMLIQQYFNRYHMPMMYTETNQRNYESAEAWLREQFSCVLRLKYEGFPLIGFTWYSLVDQVDWNTSLREDNGHVDPLGLYDLDRKIRPVGKLYKELVAQWHDILTLEMPGNAKG